MWVVWNFNKICINVMWHLRWVSNNWQRGGIGNLHVYFEFVSLRATAIAIHYTEVNLN